MDKWQVGELDKNKSKHWQEIEAVCLNSVLLNLIHISISYIASIQQRNEPLDKNMLENKKYVRKTKVRNETLDKNILENKVRKIC